MKVSVELVQKLCNITRVEMPIGGREKVKKKGVVHAAGAG